MTMTMTMTRSRKMRSARLSLCVAVLTGSSCGFPRVPDLTDGSSGSDGASGVSEPRPFGLELLAGDIGGIGNVDGIGINARFNQPTSVAVDSTGNVYVADRFNDAIRKITTGGFVTTLAGTAGIEGGTDGAGAAARFKLPTGVAVDDVGNVYVADEFNDTIRKITADGVVTTLAGTAGMAGSADGSGAAARFDDPCGVAVDNAGSVYVADMNNNTIRKITANGVVTTLAGTPGMRGSTDGTGAAARFYSPAAVATDSAGGVYVADRYNNTIRKVTANGVVTTLAGFAGVPGSVDGTSARFNDPTGVAVDSTGNIYVADLGNYTIRKITPGGVVTTLAGTAGRYGSDDDAGPLASFDQPFGVTADSMGNVYVADLGNETIRKITPSGVVTTVAGIPGKYGSVDDIGVAARFDFPEGVAVDGAENVYVADTGNNTIRKITPSGVVTTVAGTAGVHGSADGTGAAALFYFPHQVAVDSAGNVYVADRSNSTIRRVTSAGVVTTLAGAAGMFGSADGTGGAARFYLPEGIAADSAGNVYVADTSTPAIRRITTAGAVTTQAGAAGRFGSADGTGAAAQFEFPYGVAIDSTGNLYVADTFNDTIRKVTTAGVVTTLAGTARMSGSTDGTGAGARFNHPTGMAVDGAGNVYVADTNNSTIRKITPTGTTTTVAGMAGVAGILLGAVPRFTFPQYLAIVGDSIVVSDNHAILLLRHGAQ